MLLQDIFRPESIKTDLEANNKDELFEELADCFSRDKKTNRKEILSALKKREAKMSTCIQKGVAIPHGKTAAVESVLGVLGISRKGVDYDSLDGEPVYVLFALVAPEKDTESQLKILKRLAALLDNPQFLPDLQAQNNAEEVCRLICKYELGK